MRWRLLSINYLKEWDGFKWKMDCSSVLSVPEHSSINVPLKGITVKNMLSHCKVTSVLTVRKSILIYVTLRCTCQITVRWYLPWEGNIYDLKISSGKHTYIHALVKSFDFISNPEALLGLEGRGGAHNLQLRLLFFAVNI